MKKVMVKFFCLMLFFICGASCFAGAGFQQELIDRAGQGDTRAMCKLAQAYYEGKGVLKDPFKARCWAEKAWNMGSGKAKELWDELELWRYPGECNLFSEEKFLPEHDPGEIRLAGGISFVWVPGGCFKMGCHENAGRCGKDETPLHRVCLDGFWMGRFEVTQAQWENVMNTNPSRFKNGGKFPVERVSFEDVRVFIEKLNEKSSARFALPTEAQWEYACRNRGRKIPFAWGREDFRPRQNCGTCDSGSFRARTSPVGSFEANDLGIFDLGGNVKEWCRDGYDEDAYNHHEQQNPVRRKRGGARVVRGGSFADNVQALGCSRRSGVIPGMKDSTIGFRLVLEE